MEVAGSNPVPITNKMKTAVTPYVERLQKVEDGLEDQAYKIISEIQKKIIDFVREEQLFEKGIDGKGNRLKPYTAYTVALKKQKGEVYNRTTLLDTGDFYDNMYVTASNGTYTVTSSDSKTPLITEIYGDKIMVLTDEHNTIVNKQEILPRLIEWIISQIFKK